MKTQRTKSRETNHSMVDRMLSFIPPETIAELTTAQCRRVAKVLLQMAAFHEAGHTAVLYFFGISKPHTVTIASGESAASCHHDVVFDNADPQDLIVSCLAGHAAEYRFLGKPFMVGDVLDTLVNAPTAKGTSPYSDLSTALILAAKVTETLEKAGDMVLALADRANEIMETPAVWQRVEQLAAVLLKSGTVEADQIEEILGPLWCAGIA
ncbi:MAG: hypothetical protein ACYC99_03125 [Candidatus Geothermincolia bacterium]